jgi:Family of unknown function (DUF6326)
MVSTANSRILEDEKIGVRLKISALWVATLFVFAYGDIFGFFKKGQIEDVIGGEVGGINITQVFLFAVSVYVAIASVMVFLSLVLKPSINRRTNIVVPILYMVSIVATVIGETWAFLYLLSIVGIALLVLIVWHAWRWPGASSGESPSGARCCHSSSRCPSGSRRRTNLPCPSASGPTVTAEVSTPSACRDRTIESTSSTR